MIEQRSDEWRHERAGKLTASRFADVIKRTRDNKPTAAYFKYMRELAFERMTGMPKHQVSSKSLAWGTGVEETARKAYELETGDIVIESPFVVHPNYQFIGCSPDGLIGDNCGYESKCPMDESVHIDTLLEGMPEEHKPQVQGSMLVTGRKNWVFVSYDPRQAEDYRLYYQNIPMDEDYCAHMLGQLILFNDEVEKLIAALKAKKAA